MTDHRRLQRTLLRMQADPGFAAAILRGDAEARASTGLEAADLEHLEACHPAALSADAGGRRRSQILGNSASEFLATLRAFESRVPDLLESFASSAEFHAAIRDDGRLPLAFAAFAARRARELDDAALGAVVALELEMARLRREVRDRARLESGTGESGPAGPAVPERVRLSDRARVVEPPAGTLGWSEILRWTRRSEAEEAPAAPEDLGAGTERVLLFVPHPVPHAVSEVRAEVLIPPIDAFLIRARTAVDAEERARFARASGGEPADLESFLADFVREGVLVPAD